MGSCFLLVHASPAVNMLHATACFTIQQRPSATCAVCCAALPAVQYCMVWTILRCMLCCVQSVRGAAGTSLASSKACLKALRDRCAQQDAAALLVSEAVNLCIAASAAGLSAHPTAT